MSRQKVVLSDSLPCQHEFGVTIAYGKGQCCYVASDVAFMD